MSIEAITFVKTLRVANPRARLLLGSIAENTFNDSGLCRVTQEVLCYDTTMPERTVRYHLRKLEQDGLIVVTRRRGKLGQHQNNDLEIVGFKDWLGAIRGRVSPPARLAGGCGNHDATTGNVLADGHRQPVAGPYKDSRTSEVSTREVPLNPPLGGGDEVEDAVDEKGTILEQLAQDGIDEGVLRHLIAPVVEARRIGGTNGNPRSALRDVARAAKGLGEEALRRAAADVLDSAAVKVRISALTDAVAQAHKAGARIVIQSRTPQWAAWERHFVTTAPDTARLMRRWTSWQVPATWPPPSAAPDVEQTGPAHWRLSWGTPEHAAWLAVMRRRDAAAAQAADVSQRVLTEASRWPDLAPALAGAQP